MSLFTVEKKKKKNIVLLYELPVIYWHVKQDSWKMALAQTGMYKHKNNVHWKWNKRYTSVRYGGRNVAKCG